LNVTGILGTAIGLAVDAFSVAIAVGATLARPSLRHYFRISFHFGLFQFMMPLIGYFSGLLIDPLIEGYDYWVAMALLTLVGMNMIRASFSEKRELDSSDPSRGVSLVILSFATSIDALVAGISLGILGGPILMACLVIGIVTGLFSILGISLGNEVGSFFGRKVAIPGGLILIAIGITIVLEHIH
jgi:putative Mn2+ efflux pump MntP